MLINGSVGIGLLSTHPGRRRASRSGLASETGRRCGGSGARSRVHALAAQDGRGRAPSELLRPEAIFHADKEISVHRGGQFGTGTSVLTRPERRRPGAHAVRAVQWVHSCMRNALRAPCEQMVGPSLEAGRLACVVTGRLSIYTPTLHGTADDGRTTKRLVCGARCVRASRWQHAQTRQLSRFRCIPGLSWELRQCAMDSLDSSVGLCGGARMQTGFARCWRHSQTPRRSS